MIASRTSSALDSTNDMEILPVSSFIRDVKLAMISPLALLNRRGYRIIVLEDITLSFFCFVGVLLLVANKVSALSFFAIVIIDRRVVFCLYS